LFSERFLGTMREWATSRGVRLRMQNYGMPPASLASHQAIDIPDGEGFEWRALSSSRWASSAAHLFGKPIVSSEAWTWLHSPAFRATPLDLKAEADLHFLSGVNQLIGHGWPYSPPPAGTPGWMFYAAGVYSDKNPWWPVMPDLARYLQRVSFVLRQGEPVADVALYAPTDDAWAQFRPGVPRYLNLFTTIRELIGLRIIPAILDAGHTFDLIDDGTLEQAKSRRYRAIVLPSIKRMPDATRTWLSDFAAVGGRVLEADGLSRLVGDVPPDVASGDSSIGFVHRRLADAEIYFLANTSNVARQVRPRFRDARGFAQVWNPLTGAIVDVGLDGGAISLAFEPYGSRIVVLRGDKDRSGGEIARTTRQAIELRSNWTVTLGSSRSIGPVDLPYEWASTAADRFFSGTASFRRSVDLPSLQPGGRVVLDFGDAASVEREALPGGTMRGNSFAALIAAPIREAATAFLNGRRAGTIWAPPYRLDVTTAVQAGANDLRIDVYNTAINRLAEGGHLPDVGAVTERYGQRFRLQDVDNLQPIPSGILAVPRLAIER
jgi:alpha-L-rhamnosidase